MKKVLWTSDNTGVTFSGGSYCLAFTLDSKAHAEFVHPITSGT